MNPISLLLRWPRREYNEQNIASAMFSREGARRVLIITMLVIHLTQVTPTYSVRRRGGLSADLG